MREWSVEAYTRDNRKAVVMRCGNGCCDVSVEPGELAEFLIELGKVIYELEGARINTAELLLEGWTKAQKDQSAGQARPPHL